MNLGIIFAGGSGRRMHTKGIPKQFLEIEGKPIIISTLEIFERCSDVDAVIVVCLKDYIAYLEKLISRFALQKIIRVIPGGASGQESIFFGLCAAEEIAGEQDAVVLIHDGVRPLITEELITENIITAKKYGNAVTVAPVNETIIQCDMDTSEISRILDRSTCFVAKAPQTFMLKDILSAHRNARNEGKEFIDSASMMQDHGMKLYTVESTPDNIKVTTPSDYYMLKAFMQEKEHSRVFGL